MLQVNLEIQRRLQDRDTEDVTHIDILGMINVFLSLLPIHTLIFLEFYCKLRQLGLASVVIAAD